MSKTCEQVPFTQLAEQYGTPLYVYSQSALTDAYRAYETAFSGCKPLICYAVKANGNLSVLKHFAALGSGFDTVSGGEIARALAAGADASKIIYSGVGKRIQEIAYALDVGIKCFNVESLPELDRINEVAGMMGLTAPISLRINPDVDAKTHPYISTGLKANKFGIAMADAERAYQYASSLKNLKIIGIDCHIGSQLTELSPLVEACERMLALVDKLAAQGIKLEHIDLGGGVGIVYKDEQTPDLAQYAAEVEKMLASHNLGLVLEPGRSLVGNAGTLLTRVEFVKRGEEKNFVVVDAAMNDLMRPALYQAYHHIENAEETTQPEILADVVGPICETGDFIGKERMIAAKTGDVLLVHSAGAYASSMASNYNARGRAAEVMVNGAEHKLVRRRENIDDLIALERDYL
ncbi:diaminopimelate decarboxylase [Kingella negevensis]|uniref:diaminopimelate decarboxylase n=1 Tax=Kingella negevensis TaxID=1522312 RepID=UPI00254363EA|nr:diaminopimelate decarboxylase [Kingella negevensis]MDK4685076.1 diaminopimelate decarboxylase [Kingella negevensis]MDK4697263.1 diaminopimelate decarboxylase [Kingella negevensis]MDK4706838.1 diaminopimelate decarboxylase [Kingella negevensis]MDK4708856.1 diaminopimelate decarboxylase [Kingella negevensis]WII93397.1 diaminopimelate decarboxylase [Kingella negevensis]